MVQVFQTQWMEEAIARQERVWEAREALAALTLFVEAAQKETATVELVRRVIQKVEGVGR